MIPGKAATCRRQGSWSTDVASKPESLPKCQGFGRGYVKVLCALGNIGCTCVVES